MKNEPSKTEQNPDDKRFRRGAPDAPNRQSNQQGVGLDDRNQEQPLDRKRVNNENGPRDKTDR